jgi:hypothetical protein
MPSSPVTPTFSRSGHSRYSSSTSSLEQILPSCSESPSSPTQASHNVPKASITQLPDVQEDPLREEEDVTVLAETDGLYDCLCKWFTDASFPRFTLTYTERRRRTMYPPRS